MEYTKGEWKFKREEYIVNDVFSSIEAGDIKICYLKEPHYVPDTGDRTWYNGAVKVMKANAHLIATAPDMYEELQRSQWLLGQLSDELRNDLIIQQLADNRKALAKAEGK